MAYLKGQKTSSVDEVYEEFLVTIGPPWGPPRGAPRGKDLRFWWKKLEYVVGQFITKQYEVQF